MSKSRRRDAEFNSQLRAVCKRVETVLDCVNRISPDVGETRKRDLVNGILSLFDGVERRLPAKQITAAQAVTAVWENSQCVKTQVGHCPLLIFGDQLADELNHFFSEE